MKGGKKEEEEVTNSPAKTDKDGVEEGEIRSTSKEKRRDRDSRSSRDSKERSRDSASRDREVRSSMSRERDHGHRSNGDMGPPVSGARGDRSSVRRSQERDVTRR